MLQRKIAISVALQVLITTALLFAPAGTLDWWRGWSVVAAFLVGSVVSIAYLWRKNRPVLETRMKSPIQKDQPLADKVIVAALIAAFVGLFLFIPLDVFHWHFFPRPGLAVSLLGAAFFIAGWWIVMLALKQNPYAAPAVTYQKESRQKVIESGAYSIVRHPLYSGTALLVLGMALWLGSYAAALFAIVPAGLLTLRIHVEEEYLRRALPGYAEYTQKVKYRLIPFVW